MAEKVCPLSVNAGAGVMMGEPMPRVEVWPLTTMIEPPALDGREYVVPETTIWPPGVSVVPGPRTNSGVPLATMAVICCPLTVKTGNPVAAVPPRVWVTPLTT